MLISGNNHFGRFTGLKEFTAPGLEILGAFAFYNCTSLTAVNLPSATFIEFDTFRGCTALADVYFGAKAPSPDGTGIYTTSWWPFRNTKDGTSDTITIHAPATNTGYNVEPWLAIAADGGIAEGGALDIYTGYTHYWGENHNNIRILFDL